MDLTKHTATRQRIFKSLVVSGGLLPILAPIHAAEPELSGKPKMIMPEPLQPDETGFVSLFDGRTLEGWEGDPVYWRVVNGHIVGEITPDTVLENRNSFIIWRGGTLKDFELKLEYRISSEGNSGVNYRSGEMPETKWGMRGYQFDIAGPEWNRNFAAGLKKWGFTLPSAQSSSGMAEPPECLRVTGQNYEERARQILALPGLFTRTATGQAQRVAGYIDGKECMDDVSRPDWNEVHVIARGNLLIHMLNDHIMSIVVDDDASKRRMEGKLGMQVHAGPPMKVEFRHIRLKTL